MKYGRHIVSITALGAVLIAAGPVRAEPAGQLRIVDISPDSFDLVLMSVINAETAMPTISLNHRSGRTYFAQKGDTVLDYSIHEINVSVERVFDPAMNAEREIKHATAVLKDRSGNVMILRMGVSAPLDGFRAMIVNVESGESWNVRTGDTVSIANVPYTAKVLVNGVELASGSAILPVTFISEAEKTQVAAVREKQKTAYENRQHLLRLMQDEARKREQQQNDEMLARLARIAEQKRDNYDVNVEIRSEPKFFFGTECLYPVEFKVIQTAPYTHHSRRLPVMVIPTRFEKRLSGIGMNVRAD